MTSGGAQPPERPKRSLTLSPIQVAASCLASVTAAIVASYFGVRGTIIGTAIVSVASTVGSALYAHSLHRGRERLHQAWTQGSTFPFAASDPTRPSRATRAIPDSSRGAASDTGRRAAGDTARGQAADTGRRAVADSGRGNVGDTSAGVNGAADDATKVIGRQLHAPAHRQERAGWLRHRRFPLVAGLVATFVVAMGIVTVIELATGAPLAHTIGSSSSDSGLTINGGSTSKSTPSPSTTTTPTSTTNVSPTSTTPPRSTPATTSPHSTPTTAHGSSGSTPSPSSSTSTTTTTTTSTTSTTTPRAGAASPSTSG